MFLNIDNPVYNTIIVFLIIMLILYTTKPEVVYDNEKNEFRQFGTTDGKTLLPIYVVGILMAIILYVFFYYVSKNNKGQYFDESHKSHKSHKSCELNNNKNIKINTDDTHALQGSHDFQCLQQLQIQQIQQQQVQLQNIQNQINQLTQQQMTSQLLNQQLLQTPHINTTNDSNILNKKTNLVLPNEFNI